LGEPYSRSGAQKKLITFFLDECLPYHVALILKQVGYPITCWYEEFQRQQGLKDPYLIQYMGAKHYIWITKDDTAKREHEPDIRAAQISVIWVSGLERPTNKPKQNFIAIKDLHRMLTEKLDNVESMIANSNKPQYFRLTMRSDGRPRLTKTTLEEFFHSV
jgi:predicted nuclease of predicted toxin-antitoxin system